MKMLLTALVLALVAASCVSWRVTGGPGAVSRTIDQGDFVDEVRPLVAGSAEASSRLERLHSAQVTSIVLVSLSSVFVSTASMFGVLGSSAATQSSSAYASGDAVGGQDASTRSGIYYKTAIGFSVGAVLSSIALLFVSPREDDYRGVFSSYNHDFPATPYRAEPR